jgi:hypothetical protein
MHTSVFLRNDIARRCGWSFGVSEPLKLREPQDHALPLIQWTTVRLVVSENDWRRHDREMEPQRRGSVSPLRTQRPNRATRLRRTTLRSRVHVQTVGLNAETKTDRHRAVRGGFSLDIPFYRTCLSNAITQDFGDPCAK